MKNNSNNLNNNNPVIIINHINVTSKFVCKLSFRSSIVGFLGTKPFWLFNTVNWVLEDVNMFDVAFVESIVEQSGVVVSVKVDVIVWVGIQLIIFVIVDVCVFNKVRIWVTWFVRVDVIVFVFVIFDVTVCVFVNETVLVGTIGVSVCVFVNVIVLVATIDCFKLTWTDLIGLSVVNSIGVDRIEFVSLESSKTGDWAVTACVFKSIDDSNSRLFWNDSKAISSA